MNGTPHDPARLSPQALEALEETLAAHALGALPEAEAQAVGRHLATCAACRAVTADLTATVALLATVPEPAAPSAAIKERLLAAARAEQASGGTAAPDRAPTRLPQAEPGLVPTPASEPASGAAPLPPGEPGATVAPLPFPGRARRAPRSQVARRAAWSPWAAGAAAAVLVALGMGIWNAQLRGELRAQQQETALIQSARQAWALAPTPEGRGGRGLLVERAAGAPPVLLLQDLPRPPADRTYQVWVIRDGPPASAAVLQPGAGGQQVIELQQDLEGARTVAVSVEPAGGSPSPTGPVVLAGNL